MVSSVTVSELRCGRGARLSGFLREQSCTNRTTMANKDVGNGNPMNKLIDSGYKAGNGRSPFKANECNKLDDLRIQVDETSSIMRNTMIKAFERDILLNKLDDIGEHLTSATQEFSKSARRTSRKMWWRNTKLNLAVAVLVVVLIAVVCIVVPISVRHT